MTGDESAKASPEAAGDASDGQKVPTKIEAELTQKLTPLVPAEKRPQMAVVLQQVLSKTELFAGPMPHPRHLEHYEQVLPGAAERILSMAEAAAGHRRQMQLAEQAHQHACDAHQHECDRKFLKLDGIMGLSGQYIGGGILFGMIGSALYCVVIGQVAGAATFMTAAAVSSVASAIVGRGPMWGKQRAEADKPEAKRDQPKPAPHQPGQRKKGRRRK